MTSRWPCFFLVVPGEVEKAGSNARLLKNRNLPLAFGSVESNSRAAYAAKIIDALVRIGTSDLLLYRPGEEFVV